VGSNPTLAAVVLITTLAQFMKPMPDFPLRMFRERVGPHAQISVVIYGKPGRPNELGELAFGHDPYVFDYLSGGLTSLKQSCQANSTSSRRSSATAEFFPKSSRAGRLSPRVSPPC
jgi:hypothetical protein